METINSITKTIKFAVDDDNPDKIMTHNDFLMTYECIIFWIKLISGILLFIALSFFIGIIFFSYFLKLENICPTFDYKKNNNCNNDHEFNNKSCINNGKCLLFGSLLSLSSVLLTIFIYFFYRSIKEIILSIKTIDEIINLKKDDYYNKNDILMIIYFMFSDDNPDNLLRNIYISDNQYNWYFAGDLGSHRTYFYITMNAIFSLLIGIITGNLIIILITYIYPFVGYSIEQRYFNNITKCDYQIYNLSVISPYSTSKQSCVLTGFIVLTSIFIIFIIWILLIRCCMKFKKSLKNPNKIDLIKTKSIGDQYTELDHLLVGK